MQLPIDKQIDETQRLLESYMDLATDMADDDAFVARGNGFCDRKYSDDFIELQVAQLTARMAGLQKRKAEEETLRCVKNNAG